mmetsp:Transcript_24898/g.62628  ORF Transcript_24898/g.62628 Transcript_24898/m.62628 type:complete len:766 (-) Transcript_24898:751-3048(-)|eukprot:g13560.t1
MSYTENSSPPPAGQNAVGPTVKNAPAIPPVLEIRIGNGEGIFYSPPVPGMMIGEVLSEVKLLFQERGLLPPGVPVQFLHLVDEDSASEFWMQELDTAKTRLMWASPTNAFTAGGSAVTALRLFFSGGIPKQEGDDESDENDESEREIEMEVEQDDVLRTLEMDEASNVGKTPAPKPQELSRHAHSGEFLLAVSAVRLLQTTTETNFHGVFGPKKKMRYLPEFLISNGTWDNTEAARWVIANAFDAYQEVNELQNAEADRMKALKTAAATTGVFNPHAGELIDDATLVDGFVSASWYLKDRSLADDLFSRRYPLSFFKKIAANNAVRLNVHGITFLHSRLFRAGPIVLNAKMTFPEFVLTYGPEEMYCVLLQLGSKLKMTSHAHMLNSHDVSVREILCARGWLKTLQAVLSQSAKDSELSCSVPSEVANIVWQCPVEERMTQEMLAVALRHQQKEVFFYLAARRPDGFLAFVEREFILPGKADAHCLIEKEKNAFNAKFDFPLHVDTEECSPFFRQLLVDAREAETAIVLEALARVSSRAGPAGVEENENCGGSVSDRFTAALRAVDLRAGGALIAENETEMEIEQPLASTPPNAAPCSLAPEPSTGDRFSCARTPLSAASSAPSSLTTCTGSCRGAKNYLHLQDCDCTDCVYGLSRAREYAFFVRKKLQKVAKELHSSAEIVKRYGDAKKVKIELDEEQKACKLLFAHDAGDRVVAPNIENLESVQHAICRTEKERFKVVLPKKGFGFEISPPKPIEGIAVMGVE